MEGEGVFQTKRSKGEATGAKTIQKADEKL